jgi:hypothetical protein
LIKIDEKFLNELIENSSFDMGDHAWHIESKTEDIIEDLLNHVDEIIKKYIRDELKKNLTFLGLDKIE